MRLALTILATAGLSLACAKPSDDSAMHDPGHHEHEQHGHHGHHGHGGHDVNEHGYKGHRFDDPEQWTATFESAERTAWQKPDELVASLALAPDASVADLGAGTGYFSVRFAAAAPNGKVYAVDIEPNMVAWLAQRAEKEQLANLEAIQGAAEQPNLPGKVDVAFMCNVFHHLADAKAYFEAVAGSLEPGGRVVIVDFRKDNPEHAPGPPAAMRMSASEIVAIMTAAGYTLARQDDALLEYQFVLEFVRA